MDIQSVREEVEKLRNTIQNEIETFEEKTSVFIKDIGIDRRSYYKMGSERPYYRIKIFLEVRL